MTVEELMGIEQIKANPAGLRLWPAFDDRAEIKGGPIAV